jgi:hypothetical protein
MLQEHQHLDETALFDDKLASRLIDIWLTHCAAIAGCRARKTYF